MNLPKFIRPTSDVEQPVTVVSEDASLEDDGIEDSIGNALLALNHLAIISDDLYAAIGENADALTGDDVEAILNAYDILSEIHDKYDARFDLPSDDFDGEEDFDDEFNESVILDEAAKSFKFNAGKHDVHVGSKRDEDGKFSISVEDKKTGKLLHRCRAELKMSGEGADNENSRIIDAKRFLTNGLKESVEVNESVAWQSLVKTLKGLGLTKAPIGKATYGDSESIGHLFGVSMRAGKFADTYFAISYDDEKPYIIVTDKGETKYDSLSDALAAIKKIAGKIQESLAYDLIEHDASDEVKSIVERALADSTEEGLSLVDKQRLTDLIESTEDASIAEAILTILQSFENEEITEAFDEAKFKRLASTGLVAASDITGVVKAMKQLEAGKVLSPIQKDLITSTFMSLIGLVTGDATVLTKLQTAVKKDSTGE